MHKNKNKNNSITRSLVAITALSTAILTLPSALADDGFVDVVTVTVPVSCSLGASGMNTHTASIQNGVTTENIGITSIKVICNDNTGYALYAVGFTNNEYGNNKLTSATLDSTYDILTSTSTSNTSSWAMKLTKTTNDYTPIISGSLDDNNKQTGDPDFSDYSAVPNEYTKVAYALSSTDMGANASGSNLTTTYRAYISQTQPAGTYVGRVKYTLVHPNTAPTPERPIYIQDLTLAQCQKNVGTNGNPANVGDIITVYDKRISNYSTDDDGSYAVRYINGACWMTQNLRITGTISSTDSNFDRAQSFNVCEGNLASGSSYDEARCHNSGNTTNGVWYNFTAATAGQITGNDNITVTTQDICPSGWKMPENGNNAGQIGSIINYAASFSPVAGGYYNGDNLVNAGNGYWWSATAYNNVTRYYLGYNGSSLSINDGGRYDMYFLRCVRAQ